MPSLIFGALISPVTLTSYNAFTWALCYVNDQGIIEVVEDLQHDCSVNTDEIVARFYNRRNLPPAEVIILKRGQFLIPGFIDTHTHAPQLPTLGAGQQYELLDWLAKVIFPMEARFVDEFAVKAYTKAVRRIIDSGTTTCCYYGTLHFDSTKVLADIVHEYGQRAFVGKCNMDSNSPETYIELSAEASVKDTEKIISYIKTLPSLPDGSPLVHPILTPRFAISCSHRLMSSLGSLAKSDPQLAIQTHISENPNEIEFTKYLFSDVPHVGEELTYAEVYDHFSLLRHNTVLGHGVHLEDSEMELIKQRGSGISHCPTSNFNLRSGVAKVGTWLDKGIKVGLGTDVSGGYSPSILTAIQHASIASKVVAMATPPTTKDTGFASHPLKISTLFYLSTMGGASLCNLENQIGSLEVGKAFDAVVVDIRNDGPVLNPNIWGVADDEDVGAESRRKNSSAAGVNEKEELDAMLERFLFCGDDRNIKRVYVQGKFVGGVDFGSKA